MLIANKEPFGLDSTSVNRTHVCNGCLQNTKAQGGTLGHGPLQKSLYRYDQLTQKALDDWSALGKLIFHFDLHHVTHECHKSVFLQHNREKGASKSRSNWPAGATDRLVADLAVPHGVGGIGDDGGPPLLAVVGELGEGRPFPGLNGHLQVRVRVEKHALLQTRRPNVCSGQRTLGSCCIGVYLKG